MLHLHLSNRLERLRDRLLLQLDAAAPADPLQPQQLIVPSAALRRWLSLAVADARGICANLRFDYLAQWLWQQIGRVVDGVATESPYAATRLAWRVHAAFGDAAFVATQPRLAAYLREADALMRYELACQVAALLEQYVTYRTDWLQAWAAGRPALPPEAERADEAWQAALWRRLQAELGAQAEPPAEAFAAALQRGGAALARRAGLPPVLHVFALPTMAPQHLQLLKPLARAVDIHLYVLNPCQEYWFDLVDRRRLSLLAARGQDQAVEEGHRLLGAWGKPTQALLSALVELCGEGAGDEADYQPAPGGSLLAQLQNGLLELRPPEPGSLHLAEDDRSLELHVCHSLGRELEVLQDHLLGLFAADSKLRPGDVLVVTPDLDAAAPLIDAVFGSAPKARALPYALCGGARSRINEPARCLLQLLALAGARCTATEVFALLQQGPVARRFGLDADALDRIHAWLREAGFHWALNAAQRASLELPAQARHTLADALERLFLGHAMPEQQPWPFDGRLGAGQAEGSGALALGALWRFAQALQQARETLQRPHPPEAWAGLLNRLLDEFIHADEATLDDLRELRQTLRQLVDDMQAGGAEDALPLPVLRAALQARLDDPARGGVAGGSINFASMSSLRGLPFEVVCAIGLNDGAYPSTRRPLEFDLMAQQPRPGDRRRRDDDRAQMLDLLLAARRSLYLSYTGRSVRDNAPLPPAVLVAELRDLLLAGCAGDPAWVRQRLVVEHPLQPFALQAFVPGEDGRLRSHDAELAEALRHGLQAPPATLPASDDDDADDDAVAAPRQPFFRAPLPPPGPEWRQVSLADLQAFFANPCRQLLRRRLGIALARDEETLLDDEPFLPDAAMTRQLAARLLPLLLQGVPAEDLPALARAGVELPEGPLAERLLERELPRLQAFADTLRAAQDEPTLPPLGHTLVLQLDGEPWQLQFGFADLRASGLLRWRYAPTRAADRLAAWLQHLALCAAAPAGVQRRTRWLSSDGEFALQPCADAPAQLQALLALYRQGLREPLHFFPRSAWALRSDGAGAARAAWQSARTWAEGDDPAYQLALRGVAQPLDAAFEALAEQVYGPLEALLQDERP